MDVFEGSKGLEASPLPAQIIVLPLAPKGGLWHMFCRLAGFGTCRHAGWALADAVLQLTEEEQTVGSAAMWVPPMKKEGADIS